MQQNKNVSETLEQLAKKVESNFRKNGLAIPHINEIGIAIEHYRIVKTKHSAYNIVDHKNNIIVEKINLPQTAVLLANDLALGRMLNKTLLDQDKKYGYLLFEQSVCSNSKIKSLKVNDYDRAEYLEDKYNIASLRAIKIKKSINGHFEKLQSRINNLITSRN